MSDGVLTSARRAYDTATSNWYRQREIGGIVPLDQEIPRDSDDLAAGAKYKAATPAGATVLGVWQKCKAELDAAAAIVRLSRGDVSCPSCPKPPPGFEAPRNDRLPPERDDDEAGAA